MHASRVEQAEGGPLREGQGGIPVPVACINVENVTGVEEFKARNLGVPGPCNGPPRQFERLRKGAFGSAGPGKRARLAGVKIESEGKGWMRPGTVLSAAAHEDDGFQPVRAAREDIDHLLLNKGQRFTLEGREHAAHLEIHVAGKFGAIDECQATSQHVRFRNPIFRGDFKAFDGNKIKTKEVWKETPQARRCVECGRIRDCATCFDKAVEQAQVVRTQAEGGSNNKAGRFTTAQIQFPDMIVDVVGHAQACICGESEAEWIAGAQ